MRQPSITARLPSRNAFLLAFATLLLGMALAIAWVLGFTLFYPDSALAHAIPRRDDLIRAHIDYLMMAQFVFVFALLFRQYAIRPPIWMIVSICFGTFNNPLSFALRALRPKIDPATLPPVEPHFPLIAGVSFTLTTVGFLTAAFLAARAAWRAGDASAAPTIARSLERAE
ncbi:hypothetical protein [Methylosinus sporium]|uniref:hypothetical protein n=1 Tax=Methylosinus sporium TaxID=428 RepID=UPI00383A6D31